MLTMLCLTDNTDEMRRARSNGGWERGWATEGETKGRWTKGWAEQVGRGSGNCSNCGNDNSCCGSNNDHGGGGLRVGQCKQQDPSRWEWVCITRGVGGCTQMRGWREQQDTCERGADASNKTGTSKNGCGANRETGESKDGEQQQCSIYSPSLPLPFFVIFFFTWREWAAVAVSWYSPPPVLLQYYNVIVIEFFIILIFDIPWVIVLPRVS